MQSFIDKLGRESIHGKILFLNPNSRSRSLVSCAQPFGLMSLMACCRDLSIQYTFIDADAHNLSDLEVITAINETKCDYIGVPLVSLMAAKIFPFLERIKLETGTTLIVGGPLPTSDVRWLMESCRAIDYSVMGEGEAILPQLLLSIEKEKPLGEIPGIAFWENEQLIVTRRTENHIPSEALPMPDFDSIDYRLYAGAMPVGAWPSVNILANRGCPYQCTFCCNTVWGHKPHAVPALNIVHWLERIAKKGIKEVFFVDDTFNITPIWLEELCLSIIRSGLHEKMIFRCLFRADLTRPEQLELARKAGFWLIGYGAESGCQKILDYYKKHESLEDVAVAIEMTKAAGLKSLATFIAGAPIDTADTLIETANFIRQTDPTYAPVQLLHPFIGAEISEDIISKEILTAQEIRDYDHTNHTIRTLTLSTEELMEIVDWMHLDFSNFKKSIIRRKKRQQELSLHGMGADDIERQIEAEAEEVEFLENNGLPRSQLFNKSEIGMSWVPEDIILSTQDIRINAEEWYESEKELRWSYQTFELPFFLKDEREYLEIQWASMRTKTKITMTFFCTGHEFSIVHKISDPSWRIDKIRLPHSVKGPIWVKFEIHDPYFAPEDPRELGMAFKMIQFI